MKFIVDFIEKWRIAAVLELLNGKILDIGCQYNHLVGNYGNGVGVDIYPWAGIDVLIEDSSKLPFKDESFDTVTIIAALNHIPNRKACIRDVHRVLKNDGVLIITMITPTVSKIWHKVIYRWDEDQHERGMIAGEVWGFTKKEMVELFTKNKFTIVSINPFMLGFNTIYIFRK